MPSVRLPDSPGGAAYRRRGASPRRSVLKLASDIRGTAIRYPEFRGLTPAAARKRFAAAFDPAGPISDGQWRFYHWLRLYGSMAEIKRAEDAIAAANLGLLARFSYVDDGDGECMLAFLRAIRGFDPRRGITFSTYCVTAVQRASWRAQTRRRRKMEPDESDVQEGVVAGGMLTGVVDGRPDRSDMPSAHELAEQLPLRSAVVIGQMYPADGAQPGAGLREVGTTLGITKERVREIRADALVTMKQTATDVMRFDSTPRVESLRRRVPPPKRPEMVAALEHPMPRALWKMAANALRERDSAMLGAVADMLEMGAAERSLMVKAFKRGLTTVKRG